MNTMPAANRKTVQDWGAALKQAIKNTACQAPVAARAINMTFEAIYNAWVLYQPTTVAFSVPTNNLVNLRHVLLGNPLEAKLVSISYAAYTVLSDLFPSQIVTLLNPALDNATSGLNSAIRQNVAAAAGVTVGRAIIADRANDGSNQKGSGSTEAIYADTTGYVPVAIFDMITDANNIAPWAVTANQTRFMPLRFLNASNVPVTQSPLTPHWGHVKTAAMAFGSVYRPADNIRLLPSTDEVTELLTISANFTTHDKAQVERFAANPGTVSPPGQWVEIAEIISALDLNDLDKDVKLFFGVGQAVLDASICAWDTKYAYDSVRPVTYIRNFYRGQTISAWGGSGTSGPTSIQGEAWRAYQRTTNPTPPFPEIQSGHSTFSGSAATIIAALRRSDYVNFTLTQPANSVPFDVNMPPTVESYNFSALSQCADAAGYSRRLGGIHFAQGDYLGRSAGKRIGEAVYNKCLRLFGTY